MARGPLSVTRRGNAHLTLKFLGDVAAPAGIAAVGAALSGVRFAPFALRLAGGGFFPGPDQPRVLWAGVVDGAGACRALAAQVETVLTPLGFPPEGRPYVAHLTLGRVKDPGRGGDWPGMARLLAQTVWPPAPVACFALYRSLLSSAGPRYEVLATFAASGEPA